MGKKMICLAITLAAGLAVPAGAELVGYWKLNDGQGAAFWDETAYWHDGTIDPANESQVRWTTDGYEGGALEFVTATGPFTLCDVAMPSGVLNVSQASYSFWMKMPTVFQAWGIIFVMIGSADDHSLEPDGAADVFVGRPIWFGTSGAKLNDSQWHHVAVVYDSSISTIKIYVDSRLAASSAGSLSDAISTVRIGGPRSDGRAQWRRFIGVLDEVAVWNHSLSAADVENVFWVGPQWLRYATNPQPADGTTVGSANPTLTWTPGETAAEHHVYVGPSEEDVRNGTGNTDQGVTSDASFSGYPWELGKTYFWRVDEVEADGSTVYPGAVWSFTVSAKLASLPVPADGAILVDPNVTLIWTPGSGAVSHSVYIGTDANAPALVSQNQTAATYAPIQLEFGTRYYWRVDEFDGVDTHVGDVWSFKTTPDIQVTDPNFVGWWTFDQDENGIAIDWSGNGNHGRTFGDPNRIEGYNLGALAFDGLDDRVEVPQVITGDLTLMAWMKTSTPGPEGTTGREGNGLLWSDHAGGGDHFTVAVVGTKLAFETGPGGNPTTFSNRDVVTGEWVHVAVTRLDSSSEVEVLVNGTVDATGTHSGDNNVGSNPLIEIGANTLDSRYFTGLIDEVRAYNRVLTQVEIVNAMRGNLKLAWNPSPAINQIVDLRYDQPLSWSAGDGAAQHDVYFGTDKAAVQTATAETTGIYKGRQTETTYDLAESLAWDTVYFWRVDEIAQDRTVTAGNVWTLVVGDYLIVDDFESYTDDMNAVEAIFQTWLDGYDIADNGSQVGYWETPFAEQTIVHDGRQSMPLQYANSGDATRSEAKRNWTSPQDWTVHDLGRLVLYVRGLAENGPTRLDVTITDATGRAATAVNADAAVVQTTDWVEWSIPFGNLAPVDMAKVETMVIGLGDRANPTIAVGTIYIDDIQVHDAR
ncbi:MAG: LamG domain-containing protein [Phycisphaerae bacterium]|nr:LamG domain-containing protein [Phycisphaerae bacterium]